VSAWAGLVLLGTNLTIAAETNSDLLDEIPPLKPPRGEMPPGFWEQNGIWLGLLGVLVVLVAGMALWLVTRPKPAIIIPPDVAAHEALRALANKPEDGKTLSRISRIIRHYFIATFDLPNDELTTSEFQCVLAGSEKIGPDLAQQVGQFLRQCDERKFGPERASPPTAALPVAAKLIECAQSRRAYLRQQEITSAARPAA
jgi:hypothetical protein